MIHIKLVFNFKKFIKLNKYSLLMALTPIFIFLSYTNLFAEWYFFCPENIHNQRLPCVVSLKNIIFYTPPDQSVPDQKTLDSFSVSRFHLHPPVHVERDLDPNQVLNAK